MAVKNLSRYIVSNLAGGINSRSQDSLLAQNEGVEVLNFTFGIDGSLQKRGGSLKYNASAITANPTHSLFRYYKVDGTKIFLAINNVFLVKGDDGLGTWTLIQNIGSSNPATMITWQDTCFIANGNTFGKYDGTSLTAVAGSPPVGSYLTVHKDRMYVAGVPANPNRVYYCGVGDPTDWDTGASGKWFDVRTDDGDVITGILPLGDTLVVYKHNSVWLIAGDPDINIVQSLFSTGVGLDAPRTLKAEKNLHYFLDRTGVHVFNGGELVNISEKIQSDVNSRGWAIDDIPRDELENAQGDIYNRQYLLSYTSLALSANTKIFVYDLRLGSWSRWEGIEAASFAVWDGVGDEGELYSGDHIGFVHKLDEGTDDNGANIECKFQGSYTALNGDTFSYKEIHRAQIVLSYANVAPVMIVKSDWGEQEHSITFDTPPDIALWDVALWDVGIWGGQKNQIQDKAVAWAGGSTKGRLYSVSIQNISSAAWTLLGFGLTFRPMPTDYII